MLDKNTYAYYIFSANLLTTYSALLCKRLVTFKEFRRGNQTHFDFCVKADGVVSFDGHTLYMEVSYCTSGFGKIMHLGQFTVQ